MQGARPIYIYRLAPCTENCSQRIYKTFSIKYLEHVHIFSTFEPKKHKSVFQAAVSTCTLKILCCGYNLATQKGRRFIKNYDTRRYKEYSFSSLTLHHCFICFLFHYLISTLMLGNEPVHIFRNLAVRHLCINLRTCN